MNANCSRDYFLTLIACQNANLLAGPGSGSICKRVSTDATWLGITFAPNPIRPVIVALSATIDS